MTLTNPIIPQGWTLIKRNIRHPRDGMYGDLVRCDATGVYCHMAAGVVRSVPANAPLLSVAREQGTGR